MIDSDRLLQMFIYRANKIVLVSSQDKKGHDHISNFVIYRQFCSLPRRRF